jgi:ABC-type lipoprotein export system ATPase subunit
LHVFLLEASDITRNYQLDAAPVAALRGVSLKVERGDFIALTGPSGCGKSTLLQICGAMDRADGGELRLDGLEVRSLDDAALTRLRREKIGFVFQFFNLLPTLSVRENIAMPLLLAKVPEPEAFERAAQLAERVGIVHRLDHLPGQISGGEAQRAALARAVIHKPGLLIADEPTGSLDSTNGGRVLDLLRDLNRDLGVAVLMATHDAGVAAAAGRILAMKDGRMVDPA